MSEFEQSSEKTEELHRSDFIKKYPYLKKLANNANFIGPNYLELNNLDTIERDTEKEYKTGTHREVIFYHDFVLKTPENIDAKSAIEIQENMPEDLPIVRYSGIIKNIGDNKEYLIEPKGTQFDKFYLASKNKINDEKFEEMLKKFISGFEKEGKIPFEFSSDDLDNHLLVFWQYDKLTLKMTDVNALRDIKDEDKTKDMPQNYLNHLKVLAKSKTLEKTDLSSEELHNKLYTHNVRVSIHHIKNELVVIYSFMDLLEHSNLTNKDESVNALKLAIAQAREDKNNLFDFFNSNIQPILKNNSEEFRKHMKQLENIYDEVLDASLLITKGNYQNENLEEIKQTVDKICSDLDYSWEYVKDKYKLVKNKKNQENLIND